MPHEIERKFLIDKEKWAACAKEKGSILQQGYLLTDPDKTIRVRVADDTGYLTIKGRNQGAKRLEYEYEIPVEEAKEMLQQFSDNSISKIRYKINVGGKIWEVDEFQGRNAGLAVAEIELEHEDETFELPEWVTVEVTDDARYYNSNLSIKPFDSW